MGLLKADVELLWWEVPEIILGGSKDYTGIFQRLYGGVWKVIFMSNPTSVLMLCCVVVGVVTISKMSKLKLLKQDLGLKCSAWKDFEH